MQNPSFPRRRESNASQTFLICPCGAMDPRLRGDDGGEAGKVPLYGGVPNGGVDPVPACAGMTIFLEKIVNDTVVDGAMDPRLRGDDGVKMYWYNYFYRH